MEVLIGIYLLLIAAHAAVHVVRQYYRNQQDLLCLRNIFLLGFIIFQLVSAAIPLLTGRFDVFRVVDPGAAGIEFAAMATVYLLIFMVMYRWGIGVRGLARRLSSSVRNPPSGTFLLFMSAVFVILSAILRFAVLIPYVGIVSNIVGVGFASAAAGLVGWVWGRRILNPAHMAWGIIIALSASAVAITGEFGRRNLVSVGAGLMWGMYFAQWRYDRPKNTLKKFIIVSVPPLLMVALYTSVRGSFGQGGLVQQVSKMAQGNLKEGLAQLASGQVTGQAALWVIENYPEERPYEHLFSIKYFFMIPIPRALWPDKPTPISTKLARQANIKGVDQGGVTLPPGIVGNAAAEGGWYALLIYAAVSGLFIRFFDEVVASNTHHPLVVLAVGTQLGQILGLPRGEPSNFANIYIMSFTGVWITMMLVAKMLDAFGVKRQLDVVQEIEDMDDADIAHGEDYDASDMVI